MKPCLVRMRWNALLISASMPGVMRSRNSTTVTSAPRRFHTEPSSSPMTPAPTTSNFFGTDVRAMAPVDDTICFSSTVTPGSGATSEPVAMMMFLAVSSRVLPSASLTETLPPLPFEEAAVIFASPTMPSTLFFLNRNSTPLVSSPTTLVFCAIMAGRSSSTLALMPSLAKSVSASWKRSEACSSALEGMQPTFRQVPPKLPRLSTQAAVRPSWPARIAAL